MNEPRMPAPGEAPANRTNDPAADYRLEDQIGFVLRRAHQRANATFNDVMGGFDVTPTQFAALAKLADLGTVSQNELGRLTAMDPTTISGVISRLVKRGYVRTASHPEDGRLLILDLTPEGAEATDGMRAIAAEVSARTLEPLDAADRRALLDLLGKIA